MLHEMPNVVMKFFGGGRDAAKNFQSLSATLAAGQGIVAGNVIVQATDDGRLLVDVGGDLAFVIARRNGAFRVRCYSMGNRIVCKANARDPSIESSGESSAKNPLCRFGPGGDFSRGYTPGESSIEELPHARNR